MNDIRCYKLHPNAIHHDAGGQQLPYSALCSPKPWHYGKLCAAVLSQITYVNFDRPVNSRLGIEVRFPLHEDMIQLRF